MKFAALLLAAGYSSRMGKCKPLLKLGGKTLLTRGVELFRAAGIDDIVVVTGYRAAEVEAEAKTADIHTIFNPDYDRGMFSSIQAGAREMMQFDGFFLLPVDIPLFHSATITTLVKNFDGHTVLIPTSKHLQGHPPLIPGQLVQAILAHDGQAGLRGVFSHLTVREIEVWDCGILLDADTPEAFAVLESRFASLSASELERDEAMSLARRSMPERGVAHGLAVAAIAVALGQRLNAHGSSLNLTLLYNGGLLHDIAKGEQEHETTGGRLLANLGLPKLAEIVAAHRSTPPPLDGRLTEKEIVCLADKLVRGTTRLSVQERFGEKRDHFAHDPTAVAAINRRHSEIRALQEMVERQTGSTLAEITSKVAL